MAKLNQDDPASTEKEGHPVQPETLKARPSEMNTDHLDGDGEVPALDGRIQALIGRQLQAHYGALVNEKTPDNLLKLLDALANVEHVTKKDS